MKKSMILATLLCLGIFGTTSAQTTPSKFIDITARTGALSSDEVKLIRAGEPGMEWAVKVNINPEALKSDRIEAYLNDQSIVIEKRTPPKSASPSEKMWYGNAILPSDVPNSDYDGLRDVRIHQLSDGRYFATIKIDNAIYKLHPTKSGTYILSKHKHMDEGDGNFLFQVKPPFQTRSVGPASTTEQTMDTIRVVVAFTKAAEQGNQEYLIEEIKDAISSANEGYAASDISLKLEIAAYALPYHAETSVRNSLIELYYQQGGMWLPHVARAGELGDVIALVIDAPGDSTCGEAASLGSDAASAMFVVQRRCLAQFSFAHEMGHLLWADHNVEAEVVSPTLIPFAHGYRFDKTSDKPGWSSVMSYTNCLVECPRKNRWSTPLQMRNGEPMGTAAVHDNRRALILTKSIVAGFYPDPSPARSTSQSNDNLIKLYTPTMTRTLRQ